MKIEFSSCSYQGGREYNEDSVRCLDNNGVFAVAVTDGLGGHGGGQIASSITAEYLTKAFIDDPRIEPDYIRHLFSEANTMIINKQNLTQKMKSTGVALFIKENTAIWGHAGDSRLYHFMDGRVTSQTLDHSVSQMAVFSGEITVDEIRHHEDRNKVYRAFGGDEHIKAEISSPLPLNSVSHAFLLCSDGFWEYVLEEEMEQDLAGCSDPHDWLQAMVARISRLDLKDNDNYTAATVFITSEQVVSDEHT